ncbi:MAG: shikimate kinase [Bacteroidales bacterium]|nr:shikimate kinase [Bacteroidales bacterium]
MIISLSGFMGCGKSTVGRELARALGCPFVDLDEYIVSCECRSIPEIFADGGEPAFRAVELQALRSVLASYGTGLVADSDSAPGCGMTSGSGIASACSLVLSLGGGTLTTPECRELIKTQCFNVYLRTSAATIRSRLGTKADASAVVSPSATADANGNPTADVKADVAKAPLRAGRPLLRPDFEKLLESRRPIYESSADIIIDTDSLSPAEIAALIAQDLP